MSSTPAQPKRRYRTTNWKQYNTALKARGSLTVWFEKNVASRTIIGPLVKQMRPLLVPLFHGLHRCLAALC